MQHASLQETRAVQPHNHAASLHGDQKQTVQIPAWGPELLTGLQSSDALPLEAAICPACST